MKLRFIYLILAFTLSAHTIFAQPSVSSAAYNAVSGVLTVSGVDFISDPENLDIDASKISIIGQGGSVYTLSEGSSVDINSSTVFEILLSATDRSQVELLLNKNGSSSKDNTTYQLNFADHWNTELSVADNGNAILVSGINSPPYATNLNITGSPYKDQKLTAAFTYNDSEGDAQGTSLFQWYRSDSPGGAEVPIASATLNEYTLSLADAGKYISFEVTPVAVTGTTTGDAVRSARIEILNAAPVASNLVVNGSRYLDQTVTASFTYTDLENDNQGTSTYRWFRASGGGPEELITGEVKSFYKITASDLNKYIFFEVTPIASSGTTNGIPVKSNPYQVLNAVPVVSSLSISGEMYYKQEISAQYTYSDLEGDNQGASIFKWYRADNIGGPDVEIPGAVDKKYKLAEADLTKFISFEVTPVAATGSSPGESVKSSRIQVLNATPVVSNLSVSGSPYLNQILTATYTFTDNEGDTEGASIYEWYRADDDMALNVLIPGATQKTYQLTSNDLNKYISFRVTPVANSGSSPGTEKLSPRVAVQNAAPAAANLSISGSRFLSQTLTANFDYSDLENDQQGSSIYRWYRSDYAGGPGVLISGATQKTYIISSFDLNKYLSFAVVPVAVSGSTTGSEVLSGQIEILNQAPVASSVGVTGSMYLSQVISGSYSYSDLESDPEGSSIFRWYRSDGPLAGEFQIAGATSKTYTLTSADLNKYISFEVIPVAQSGALQGSTVRSSRVAVLNAAPGAVSLSVSGSMYLNQVLSASYTYTDLESDPEGTSIFKWYRANDIGGPDTEIPGATSKNYTITTSDLNKYISFEVRPVASSGSANGTPVHSSRVAVLNAVPVVNAVSVTGSMYLSQTISGNYNYSDLENDQEGSGIYKWYRADNVGGPDILITGATQKTYVISSADLNKFISFEVAPVALSGTSPGVGVKSARVAVLNQAPSVSSPAVSGNMYLNQSITATYTYSDLESDAEGVSLFQWYRSDNIAGPDVPISGANQKNYLITSSDLGKFLSYTIVPVASSGTVNGTLMQSGRAAVLNAAPMAVSLTLSENRFINQTITSNYTYNDLEGDTEGASTYQWFVSDNINGPDVIISGATQKTFSITSAYLNKYLSFEILPVATSGTINGSPVRSSRYAVLNAVPVASGVSITGSFRLGQVLRGTYTYSDLEGDAEAMSAYNWYRANSADGTGKSQIIGANTRNYVVQSVDMNKYISFEVIPVASAGSIVGNAVASPFMGPVTNSAPTATNIRITGTQAVCKTLRGEYDYYDIEGDSEGATAFRWLRAATIDGDKTPINGATGRDYTLTTADQGMIIFFEVLPRAVSGTTTGTPTVGNPTGVIVNLLPTVTFLGTASICNGSSTTLTISFTGSAPWTLTYTDGQQSRQIVSGEPIYLLNVSKSGIYKGETLVDNINCPVSNLPSYAEISILPLPQVDIVGLNSAYNFRSNPVQLAGNPTGGTFTGPGVVSSTNMFYPSIAGTQNSPHTIIYEYKSPQTGCTNRDTVIVEIIDADASISGIRAASKYCNFDNPFVITGTNVLGTIGTFAITGGIGLTDNQDNTATINPSLLSAGTYTISYSYFDGIQLTIYKDFTVEVFDEARIFGLNANLYCSNINPVELSGNYSEGIFSGNSVFKNLVSNKYYFTPSLTIPGNTTIIYSYTTNYGCVISKTVEKTIAPVPDADFAISNACYNGDSTAFINRTVSTSPVVKWDWRFGDLQASEANNRSALYEPKHKYSSVGNRNVRLMAENNFGCRDTVDKTIHLGDIPIADFTWNSECYSQGAPISFKNNSVNIDEIVNYSWNIEDTSRLHFNYTTKDVLHTFPVIRNYMVKFRISTEYGCSDSIKKIISLRPVFNIRDTSYTNSFETGRGFWLPTDTISTNNWHFGLPGGSRINTAFSGSKAYYTNLKDIRKNQQLIITSPCYDFTDTKRPFITLATFTDATSGQEGAVLQYSTNQGKTWDNIGGIGSGKEWYNDFAIQSQPGGQQIGWSGRKTGWAESRHDLDMLNDQPLVRFRMVFGQSSKTTGTDGFAFDNIYIGNRSKFLLFEHFTNNSQKESLIANNLLDSVVYKNKSDVISVQYHTSFPGIDTFNIHNPSDPGSRVLFYGVGVTPFALLEGGVESENIYDFSTKKPHSNEVKRLSLKDAGFDLVLKTTKTGDKVSGSLDITALKNHTGRTISARILVLEDIVSQVSGEKVIYRNVVKKILPSAGGTVLSSNWTTGKTESVNFSWDYRNVFNPKNIQVVAFVQDELSREIYQVVTDDTSGIIDGTDVGIKNPEKKWIMNLFPNPAREWVYLEFPESEKEEMIAEVRSVNGKVVLTEKILKGVSRLELDIQSLDNGVYFVRVLNKTGVLTTRKFIVMH